MSKVWQNPGGGVRVHAALEGLTADDHPQYHNDARGDARYSQLGHTHAYLAIANNLSDLASAATARTNLGLSAGGAGDIWVQLTGDTMSGTLQIDVPTATVNGLILRSTDNSAVSPILNIQTSAGVSVVSARTVMLADGTVNFLKVTGTLPTTPSATVNGVDFTITGAGSASQIQRAMSILLAAGYTGSSQTAGLVVRNLTNGTGTSVFSGIANIGIAGTGAGNGVVPVGVNIGVWARGGETSAAAGTNYGVFAFANTAHNDATNIGVAGFAVNGGASPKIIGGYFGLQSTVPTYTSSALIADNGTQPYPVFLARDNGTIVLEIVDGGLVNIKSGTHSGGSTAGFLTVAGILPAAPSNTVFGVDFSITGAGSASQEQYAFRAVMNAGYTGSSRTIGASLQNLSAGTGASLVVGSAGTPTGNIGFAGLTVSTTTGYNVGLYGEARSGNVSIGLYGKAVTAKNSATNIGVLGNGLNTGSTPIQIGGYFSLNSSDPTFESAALIADNGSQTSPIFLGRDNGTTVFSVSDGGATLVKNSSASAFAVQNASGTAVLTVDAANRRTAINTSVDNAGLTIVPADATYNGLIIKQFSGLQLGDLTRWANSSGTLFLSVDASGHLTFANAINIVAGTGTGTKIGTGTTQKLGFWNAAPIVQPATGGAAATFVANTSAIADDSATFDGYTIGQVVKALRNTGMLA